MEQLELAFRNVFEQKFKNAQIELIQIEFPFPFDLVDPDYFNVMIVYRSDDELDTNGTVSFISDIRPKLHKLNEYRLPVMAFVEYEDYITNGPKEDVLV